LRLEILPRQLEVVVCLKIQSELRAVAEIKPKTQRGISRDTAAVIYNLHDPVRRNADSLRELILRLTVFGQKFLLQHLTRRYRREFAFG